ncbi:MAG TPA: hypothetical protein VEW03_04055, partial [Longimicrobiaceae bacterium]|nr:hypothetical protein [Longimicrobiaceae bacterium]
MADTPPDLAARIESLQASHVENPARFFMPLASAYREAGQGELAEKLLRENLKRHPGYLSAHVLLGRCLADRGAVAEARNEFQYVLSVDSQNLIALRSLGDMAAAEGDRDGALRWYGDLLAVDPMNAEAKHAIAALEGESAAAAEEFGMVDLDAGAAEEGEAAPADVSTWGEVSLDAEAAEAGAAAEGAEAPAEAPLDVEAWGEVALDEQPAAAGGDEEAQGEGAGFDALEFGSVDVSAPPEGDGAASGPPASFESWGSLDDGQLEAAGAALPVEGLGGFTDDPAHDGDEHEVVTETMAELYAGQGFLDRAADVYRELISLRGEEPALVRRLDELQAQLRSGGAAAAAAETPTAPAETDAGWLEAVDAAASAGEPEAAVPGPEADTGFEMAPVDAVAEEAPGATPLWVEPAETGGEPDEPAPDDSEAAVSPEAPDAFADSFADGFAASAGASPAAVDGDAAPAPPVSEPSAEAAEAAEEPAPAAEEARPAVTVRSYLARILAWRPAAGAAEAPSRTVTVPDGAAAPEATVAGPPAEAPPPPSEEPWSAPAAAAETEDAPGSQPAPPAAGEEDEPWGAGAGDGSPAVEAAAPEPEDGGDRGDLPWLSAGLAQADVPPPDGF